MDRARLKEKHLKMALKQNGRIFRAIAWRAVEREEFITAEPRRRWTSRFRSNTIDTRAMSTWSCR